MKLLKTALCILPVALAGCTQVESQPAQPLDTKTVLDYQKSVSKPSANSRYVSEQSTEVLNASDNKSAVRKPGKIRGIRMGTGGDIGFGSAVGIPATMKVHEQGSRRYIRESDVQTDIIKNTPTEKHTRTIEHSQERWQSNSSSVHFGLH